MVENYTMRERMSGAINALSISPEGNSVVVAGRESTVCFQNTFRYHSL
jgi:hypothetical protein